MQDNQSPAPPIRGLLWDISLNAAIPLALYQFSRRYISPSELTALIFATAFPLGKSALGLSRRSQLDPVALIVLLGILTSAAAILIGGNPKVLLIRESLFTGAFGCACLFSLFLHRPIMFYFGRYFVARDDPEKQKRFDSAWEITPVRRTHRLITIVWGLAYIADFIVRIILIDLLPSAWVLAVSPILIGATTIAVLLWTRQTVRRLRTNIEPSLVQQ
jgi:hypothetical protein